MRYKAIDGIVFERMMRGGLENLRAFEKETNELNVFPVPDGDTGTNMRRTVELGVDTAHTNKRLGEYLKELSHGMLLGARGNSGVILSQIFRGIANALARYESATASNLSAAFIEGYMAAYASVIRPVEGTILTVIREGIEHTKKQIYRRSTVETMLGVYISEMKKSLAATPYILPVLKDAGVVDSGGFGYIKLLEGMLNALYDDGADVPTVKADVKPEGVAAENVEPGDGYCMEFMLQLFRKKPLAKKFDTEEYIQELKLYGDSLVVIREGDMVRVHANTLKPEKIMAASREYGEFTSFKLDNIKLQNSEFAARKKQDSVKADFAILAVADGEGFADTFAGQGCSLVINGGKTMNTSVKEFLDAYESLGARHVAVLPNDKNIINSAKQAAAMFGGKVTVIPTADMVQGYYALASDIPDAPAEERIASMRSGVDDVVTLSVARACKDTTCDGVKCRTGEYAAFTSDKLLLSDKDMTTAVVRALRALGADQKEQILIFTGNGFEGGDALSERISAEFDVAVECLVGGQQGVDLVIGVF